MPIKLLHFNIMLPFQLKHMSYFSIIMFIVVACFGVVRQAVHFQNEEWSWFMVRSVFFYPYWMIYGEIFKEEIDSNDSI